MKFLQAMQKKQDSKRAFTKQFLMNYARNNDYITVLVD